jgi:hypothetical protein
VRLRRGPMAHDDVLPTPLDLRENDGRRGLARLRGSLQELTDLLEPPGNCIAQGPPLGDKPREGNPDWATARMNLGLAYAQRPMATGRKTGSWPSPPLQTPSQSLSESAIGKSGLALA